MVYLGMPGNAKKTRTAPTRWPLRWKLGRSGSRSREKYCRSSAEDGGAPPAEIRPLHHAGKQTDRPMVARFASRGNASSYPNHEIPSQCQSEYSNCDALTSSINQKLCQLLRPQGEQRPRSPSRSVDGVSGAQNAEESPRYSEVSKKSYESRQSSSHKQKDDPPSQQVLGQLCHEDLNRDNDAPETMSHSIAEDVDETGAQFLGPVSTSPEDSSADEITLDYYSVVGDITIHYEALQDIIDAHGEYVEGRVTKALLDPGFQATESLDDVVIQFQHEKSRYETALKESVHNAAVLQKTLLTKNVALDGEALDIVAKYSQPTEKIFPLLRYEILLGDPKDTRERINLWLLGHLRESSEQMSAHRRCLPESNKVWSQDDITWSFLIWNSWPLDEAARGPPLTPAYQETALGAPADIASDGNYRLDMQRGPPLHASTWGFHSADRRTVDCEMETRSV